MISSRRKWEEEEEEEEEEENEMEMWSNAIRIPRYI